MKTGCVLKITIAKFSDRGFLSNFVRMDQDRGIKMIMENRDSPKTHFSFHEVVVSDSLLRFGITLALEM